MSKNTYSIVNVNTNEIIAVQTAFPPCRDLCRSYLTDEANFGARLQVVKNRQEDGSGDVVFDVTNIKYSSGRVRMTLYTEFQRQQKMHEASAAKAAAREEAKAAKKAERAAAKAAKATASPVKEAKAKLEKPAKKAAAKKVGKKPAKKAK